MTRRTAKGFTLVEVIVALMVGAILAAAVTTSLAQFSRAQARAGARQEAASRAHAAADIVAADLRNICRDFDPTFNRVAIADGGEGSDNLLLWTRSLRPVRGAAEIPEGMDREVQFKLMPDAGNAGRTALWRRVDAPADSYIDAGGIAAQVVPGVSLMSVEANDGASWQDRWDSDSDGLPHGIRVTVIGMADDGRTTAVARRTIALDRTPLPPPTAETEGTDTGTTGGATTTGGGR